jgi:peroxiredoxin Q/BCP
MGVINLTENFDSTDFVRVGEMAPDFTLSDEKGSEWRLSDQLGRVTALLFYPKNETLVCTRQLCSLRDNWAEYLETKASIIGVSPGSIEEHRNFAQTYRLPLPLIVDTGSKITKVFAKHWIYPISFTRGIVVIDAKGIVRTKNIMLWAFRPSDRTVITAIHSARADALTDNYDAILRDRHKNSE